MTRLSLKLEEIYFEDTALNQGVLGIIRDELGKDGEKGRELEDTLGSA